MKNQFITYLIMSCISALVLVSAGLTVYRGSTSDSSNFKVVARLVSNYTDPNTLKASETLVQENIPVATVVPKRELKQAQPCSPNLPFMKKDTSIISYLNANGIDSSFTNRIKLAAYYNIPNYRGTASENLSLMEIIRSEKAASSVCTINL